MLDVSSFVVPLQRPVLGIFDGVIVVNPARAIR